MRLLLLAAFATIATPSLAAPAAPFAKSPAGTKCPRTTSHYADNRSADRGGRLLPRKLTSLPPAIGYMAVYRTVDGCEAPLTVVDYRGGRRR
jgi:hypothetical protein